MSLRDLTCISFCSITSHCLSPAMRKVSPEVEYIEYDVEEMGEPCYIEPQVDNKSAVPRQLFSINVDLAGCDIGHLWSRRSIFLATG